MGLLVCLAMLLFQLSNRNAFDSLKKKHQLGQGRSHHFLEVFLLDCAQLVHLNSVFDGAIVCPNVFDLVWHLFLDIHVHMEVLAGKIFINKHTDSFQIFTVMYYFFFFFIHDTSFTMMSLFLPLLFGTLCAISMSAKVRSATPLPFSMEITFISQTPSPSLRDLDLLCRISLYDFFCCTALVHFPPSFVYLHCSLIHFLQSSHIERVYHLYKKCEDANLRVTAKKGKAVLWYNHFLRDDGWMGEVDEFTLHGGCPVKKGEKWIANFWIKTTDDKEKDMKRMETMYSQFTMALQYSHYICQHFCVLDHNILMLFY